VLAPKGTPRAIVDRLNALLRRAMDDPELKAMLLKQGVVPEPSTPEQTKKIIQEDYEWNARMTQRFDIKPIE
jgi:tripartite-type tricarboxylate transporter receptor subunit TctC